MRVRHSVCVCSIVCVALRVLSGQITGPCKSLLFYCGQITGPCKSLLFYCCAGCLGHDPAARELLGLGQ